VAHGCGSRRAGAVDADARLVERATLVLRIRGADIADYMAGRLTLADVSKKVEVRKF
jgi:hypothetical protein